MSRSKYFYPCLLALLWVIMIIIVNPIGNFPLNDDWQYARPVSSLINQGHYFSPDSYSPIIVAQVYWGALFCLPGGFSFTALRISVLVLGLAGVLVFYFLISNISNNKKLSFFGALLLLINPIYFSLSNTFMTDAPFLSFALISIYLFFKSAETSKPVFLIAATMAAVFATLIRQFGIVIPIAYFIAATFKQNVKPGQWLACILPSIITIAALKLALVWLQYIGSELHPYNGKSIEGFLSNASVIATQAFTRTGSLLFYTGFFLLPFTIYSARNLLRNLAGKEKIVILILNAIFLPSLIHAYSIGLVGNIISAGAIGPLTLRYENFCTIPKIINIPYFSEAFLCLCFIGAILLLLNVGAVLIKAYNNYESLSEKGNSVKQKFILICIIGYALLMFVPDFFFDRYLLIFFPLFFLLILGENFRNDFTGFPGMILPAGIILLTSIFSILGTHDYLSSNRSRWDAWNYATDKLHLLPRNIDGGYECEGWVVGKNIDIGETNNKVEDDEYVLALEEHKGYALVKKFPFQNYLPYKVRNIYLLHRQKIPLFQ